MTEREDRLYDLMTAGELDVIQLGEMRSAAENPEEFELDYRNAYSRYQSDIEMPEEEREENTAEAVVQENTEAREVVSAVDSPDNSTTEEE